MFDEATRAADEEAARAKAEALANVRKVADETTGQCSVLLSLMEIAQALGVGKYVIKGIADKLKLGTIRTVPRGRGGRQRLFTSEEAELIARTLAERNR